MSFELPKLKYAHDALEPHIDESEHKKSSYADHRLRQKAHLGANELRHKRNKEDNAFWV